MADVRCAKCGEPWDYYGVRHYEDMTPDEAERFLRGEGCPCCKFGTACPSCGGTGKVECRRCHGYGKVVVKEARYYWDVDRTRLLEPAVLETCPDCGGTGRTDEPCPHCDGTGKLKVDKDAELAALLDEVDASDEDPLLIFERRGFDI